MQAYFAPQSRIELRFLSSLGFSFIEVEPNATIFAFLIFELTALKESNISSETIGHPNSI